MNSELFDKKTELFKEAFEKALPYEEYLKTGKDTQIQRWNQYLAKVTIESDEANILQGFVRKMNVLVLSGIWCGDCARQGPMIEAIARHTKTMHVRFADNESNPALRDELRIHGASRVPVAVTLSEDFFEINRFGDRTLSVYRRKSNQELGAACDSGIAPPASELTEEISEWVMHFERLHLMLRLSQHLRKRYKD